MSYQIILHGEQTTLPKKKIRKEVCEIIANEAEKMLKEGVSALDVCEKPSAS